MWSWDLFEDQTKYGMRFRILMLLDQHTRRCLAVHAAWSIWAVDVSHLPQHCIPRCIPQGQNEAKPSKTQLK